MKLNKKIITSLVILVISQSILNANEVKSENNINNIVKQNINNDMQIESETNKEKVYKFGNLLMKENVLNQIEEQLEKYKKLKTTLIIKRTKYKLTEEKEKQYKEILKDLTDMINYMEKLISEVKKDSEKTDVESLLKEKEELFSRKTFTKRR